MDNYKLEPLTDFERKFAEDNHNLVFGFLHRYGYSLETYYDVAVFGFLKAVQIYSRREDLRNKYAFPFISQQYILKSRNFYTHGFKNIDFSSFLAIYVYNIILYT